MIFPIFLLTSVLTTAAGALLKAHIAIDSDALHTGHFLDRLKKFVEQTHTSLATGSMNDTFQANYDFTKNLLTVGTTYTLLIQDQKLSDVKVTLEFQFEQSSQQRIILEDFHGHRFPSIGYRPKTRNAAIQTTTINETPKATGRRSEVKTRKERVTPAQENSMLQSLLGHLVMAIEPIVVTIIHVVIHGVLSNAVTDAVDRFYLGQIIS